MGNGPQRKNLKSDTGAVEFLGHVPYDEMSAVYRSGDVLLLPSRAKGFPRTVLEALASEAPVVSSKLEHTAPVIQRAGEIVPIGYIDGYIKSLIRIMNYSDELGRIGRAMVDDEFRWKNTVEQSTQILSSIVRDSN